METEEEEEEIENEEDQQRRQYSKLIDLNRPSIVNIFKYEKISENISEHIAENVWQITGKHSRNKIPATKIISKMPNEENWRKASIFPVYKWKYRGNDIESEEKYFTNNDKNL